MHQTSIRHKGPFLYIVCMCVCFFYIQEKCQNTADKDAFCSAPFYCNERIVGTLTGGRLNNLHIATENKPATFLFHNGTIHSHIYSISLSSPPPLCCCLSLCVHPPPIIFFSHVSLKLFSPPSFILFPHISLCLNITILQKPYNTDTYFLMPITSPDPLFASFSPSLNR